MNVKELKGIDVHLKEIDRLIQLSPKRTVDRSQIRNPKEIERHEQMKQYALRLGINLYMTDDTESSYDKDKEEAYLFITRGQKVPEELERKLIQREQDRIAREKQKQKGRHEERQVPGRMGLWRKRHLHLKRSYQNFWNSQRAKRMSWKRRTFTMRLRGKN